MNVLTNQVNTLDQPNLLRPKKDREFWKQYNARPERRSYLIKKNRENQQKKKSPLSIKSEAYFHSLAKINQLVDKPWIRRRLKRGTKIPIGENWPEKWEELKIDQLFQSGYDVGIMMGKIIAYDEYLTCWDFDKVKIRGKLPWTYNKTGGGGCHYLISTPDQPPTNLKFYQDEPCLENRVGDWKANGQIVWAGSTHPNGKKYELVIFGYLFRRFSSWLEAKEWLENKLGLIVAAETKKSKPNIVPEKDCCWLARENTVSLRK